MTVLSVLLGTFSSKSLLQEITSKDGYKESKQIIRPLKKDLRGGSCVKKTPDAWVSCGLMCVGVPNQECLTDSKICLPIEIFFASMDTMDKVGLGKTSKQKTHFNSGIARMWGGGFTLARIFLTLF